MDKRIASFWHVKIVSTISSKHCSFSLVLNRKRLCRDGTRFEEKNCARIHGRGCIGTSWPRTSRMTGDGSVLRARTQVGNNATSTSDGMLGSCSMYRPFNLGESYVGPGRNA